VRESETAIWVIGGSRSGKTSSLVTQFSEWLNLRGELAKPQHQQQQILVLAANDESRRDLGDRLAVASGGKYPISAKTPLGFIQDEVLLFYPLIRQQLDLAGEFPLRLRPETEQELANKLWQSAFERVSWREIAPTEYRFVRRTLDLIQLAGSSGTPLEAVPEILAAGWGVELDPEDIYSSVGGLALEWRDWCLKRGLLTYGIMTELYWRYLFPDRAYQQHLSSRYWGVIADDVDDYPAIAADLLSWLLDRGVWGAFSYHPDGKVRLGLNADPDYLARLQARCLAMELTSIPTRLFPSTSAIEQIVTAVTNPGTLITLPAGIQSIVAHTRGEMLRETAECAIAQIKQGNAQPQDIAIIAPGLDAIARYTLTDIFAQHGILLESLNDQRPLQTDPGVRALLTLLALTYPHLGQLVNRDDIADILVTCAAIDPVRAGLLADYCFAPSMSQPRLLPYTKFPRWDRLGVTAARAYERIMTWIDKIQHQQPLPLYLLDKAITDFFDRGSNLPFDRLSALRELMETAEHYWEVSDRIHTDNERHSEAYQITAQFILLLRRGTVSANPYPIKQLQPHSQAVTLSNIFQYRASKRYHPWHFWLDVGSPLWAQGGAATLYGANFFLKDRQGKPWTEADTQQSDERRLERILRDLCHRVGDRLYLCHSDLAINGQEQLGVLSSLVYGIGIRG
jgi:hypothetical protein